MSFMLYDIIFLVVFCLFLIIFLIIRRKKIKREGLLVLYRTEIGVRLINYISEKYKKLLGKAEYVIIGFGYVFMIVMLYFLFQLSYYFIKFPDFIRAVKIPPIVPLIPYLPNIFKADYLPPFYFTYWIIVLAIAAITHEFLHGIYFKRENIKIKSTGFAFLGPFLAFFVEPDEKKMQKMKIKKQLAAISAGSFANLLMTILFFILMIVFFNLFFVKAGVIFSTYSYNAINSSEISSFGANILADGMNLTEVQVNNQTFYIKTSQKDSSGLILAYYDSPALKVELRGAIIQLDNEDTKESEDLKRILETKKPKDIISVKTLLADNSIQEYTIQLEEKPGNSSQAYIGISLPSSYSSSTFFGRLRGKLTFFKNPDIYYKPKVDGDLIIFIYNLLWWMVLINLSVALGNMLPLGIFDGGRFFYLTVLAITKSEKIARRAFKISTAILLAVFVLLIILWFASL